MTEQKNWKFTEYLVQLIEKSIDPDSTVEHNVFLPDLTSSTGTTRQCDIIIRKGVPSRETITLVEVQDRDSKVDLNTFQGWVTKMRDVGAQHLICVSRAGFPESIKEKAKQSGKTIQLVTLSKADFERIPLNIFGLEINYTDSKFTILSIPKIRFPHGMSYYALPRLNSDDKVFKTHESETLVSIDDLIKKHILENGLNKDCRKSVSFPQKPNKLFIHVQDKFLKISFTCIFKLEITKYQNKEVQIYGYEQNEDDTLAWILEGELRVGEKSVAVKIPAIPQKDGTFNVRYIGLEYSLPFYQGHIRMDQ